jgi:hypothetical protein
LYTAYLLAVLEDLRTYNLGPIQAKSIERLLKMARAIIKEEIFLREDRILAEPPYVQVDGSWSVEWEIVVYNDKGDRVSSEEIARLCPEIFTPDPLLVEC